MTVRQAIATKPYNQKVWVCPDLVTDIRFDQDPTLSGIECAANTVPASVIDREVVKVFYEEGYMCIIWDNPNKKLPHL